MPSEVVNADTRAEWRELGFFYDFDAAAGTWRLIGSRSGLIRFAQLLREYVANPRRHALSEHDHYGPYLYLEVGTWSCAEINSHWIAGTIAELAQLAELVERGVSHANPGDVAEVGHQFAPSSQCRLLLETREDGFDPASADPHCW